MRNVAMTTATKHGASSRQAKENRSGPATNSDIVSRQRSLLGRGSRNHSALKIQSTSLKRHIQRQGQSQLLRRHGLRNIAGDLL